MNSISAKFSLPENLWILETKHVQTIYNHNKNIEWTEIYVYTAYSIRFHFIFNEQPDRNSQLFSKYMLRIL
jgi:hypothetical protein